VRWVSSRVFIAPRLDPTTTATRSRSIVSRSSPLSRMASLTADTASA
jgi:hypothetical protein